MRTIGESMGLLAGGFICGVAAATLAFVYVWNARAEAARIKAGQRPN